MAKVNQVPIYENQVLNKLLFIFTGSKNITLTNDICSKLKVSESIRSACMQDYSYIKRKLERSYDELLFDAPPGVDDQSYAYMLERELSKNYSKLFTQDAMETTARCALKTLSLAKEIYHGATANFKWWARSVFDDFVYDAPKNYENATDVANKMMELSLMSQKINYDNFSKAFRGSPILNIPEQELSKYYALVDIMEQLVYSRGTEYVNLCKLKAAGITIKNKNLKQHEENYDFTDESKWFEIKIHQKSLFKAFNWYGVICLFDTTDNTAYLFDYATIKINLECMVNLRNYTVYFENWRISGECQTADTSKISKKWLQIIASRMCFVPRIDEINRHLSCCFTRYLNISQEENAKADFGHNQRDVELAKEILNAYPCTMDLYNYISKLSIPDSLKFDLFKVSHTMPYPEVNILILHEGVFVDTSNKADPVIKKDFLEFCASYVLCNHMLKSKKIPNLNVPLTTDISSKAWVKKCINGKFKMPPRDEWGQIYMENEIDYEEFGNFWNYEAKDVTHIIADKEKYLEHDEEFIRDRTIHNELLWAFFRGRTLSGGLTPEEVRNSYMDGHNPSPPIGTIAAKAENTKPCKYMVLEYEGQPAPKANGEPWKKARETVSGDDHTRMINSEVDRNMRKIAASTPFCSLKMGKIKQDKYFVRNAYHTRLSSPKIVLSTNSDISEWSLKMDRSVQSDHEEVCMKAFKIRNHNPRKPVLEELELITSRRGCRRCNKFTHSSIQGWFGTEDTCLHCHILAYIAYELRRRGIINKKTDVDGCTQIDDASYVFVLSGDKATAEANAQITLDLIRDTYIALGFKMDFIKSFISSIKLFYLNDLYIYGVKIMNGMRTFAKIDKERYRRFVTLTDDICNYYNCSSAAVKQGSDPFVAYLQASILSLLDLFKLSRETMGMPNQQVALLMLTPLFLNGLGAPQLLQMCTTATVDNYSWFLEMIRTHCATRSTYHYEMNAILAQPLGTPTARSILRNPYAIHVLKNLSTTSMVQNAMLDAAVRKGLAEPFRTFYLLLISNDYEEMLINALRSEPYDAQILDSVNTALLHTVMDDIMSKLIKGEAPVLYLSRREVFALKRRQISAIRINIRNFLTDINTCRDKNEINSLITMTSTGYAKAKRDDYFDNAGVVIMNHTYGCPLGMLAFSSVTSDVFDTSKTIVRINNGQLELTPLARAPSLYDQTTKERTFVGIKTAAPGKSEQFTAITSHPVSGKVGKALLSLKWAQVQGRPYKNLAKCLIYAWTGGDDITVLDIVDVPYNHGLKRKSTLNTEPNHFAFAFVNSMNVASVNLVAMDKIINNSKHLQDLSTMIVVLREASLLDLSTVFKYDRQNYILTFTFHPGSLPKVETAEYNALDFDVFDYPEASVVNYPEWDPNLQANIRNLLSRDALQVLLLKQLDAWEDDIKEADDDLKDALGDVYKINYSQQVNKITLMQADRRLFNILPGTSTRRIGEVIHIQQRPSIAQQLYISASDKITLRVYCDAYLLTTGVNAIIGDPVRFSEMSIIIHRTVEEVEDQNKKEINDMSPWLPSRKDINKIIEHLNQTQPNYRAAMIDLVQKMFGTGFRVKPNENVTVQNVQSFIHRMKSQIIFWKNVNNAVKVLHPKDKRSYSVFSIMTGQENMLYKILQAQWMFGGARKVQALRMGRTFKHHNTEVSRDDSLAYWINEFAFAAALCVTPKNDIEKREVIDKFIRRIHFNFLNWERSFSKYPEEPNVQLMDIPSAVVVSCKKVTNAPKEEWDTIELAMDEVCNWINDDVIKSGPCKIVFIDNRPMGHLVLPTTHVRSDATSMQNTIRENDAVREALAGAGIFDEELTPIDDVSPAELVEHAFYNNDLHVYLNANGWPLELILGYQKIVESEVTFNQFREWYRNVVGIDGIYPQGTSILEQPDWYGEEIAPIFHLD
jgi:hypothetical protein